MRDLHSVFAGLAVASLGLLLLTGYRDADREWKRYQRAFYELEAERAQSAREKAFIRRTPLEIRQIVVGDLGVVDRCTTCHLAMESSAGIYTEQPFRRHPEEPKHLYYQFPFDKYGCTTCHEGQGRATTVAAAHGRVRYWDRPMLAGSRIQSSCLRCHDDADLPGAEIVMRGRELYEERLCSACHRIGAEGENLAPELTALGRKTAHHYDFSRVQGEETIETWHFEHLKDPEAIVPGSLMPDIGLTDEEAWALTVYLLSLTGKRVPQEYVAR
jgi:cytochrome c2